MLLLLLAGTLAASDPYATLGVDRRANEAEIRRAFKEQSLRWHPDKNHDPSASERFIAIKEVHESGEKIGDDDVIDQSAGLRHSL